jgi:hypothetical protein
VVEGQLDGGRGELQMLGIETAQGGVTQTAGRQQQGAVAHAAAIPGAGGGHADQGDGGGARRRLAPLRAARSTAFTAGVTLH